MLNITTYSTNISPEKKNLILFDCLESERNANEKIMGLD